MSETPFPDWLPDWRDSSQYPDPESTSRKQWAWEFLRRNSSYQAEWKQQNEADYSVHCSSKEYEPYHKQVSMVLLGGRWGLACNAPDPSVNTPEVLLFQQDYMVGATTYEDVENNRAIPYLPRDWPFVSIVFNLGLPLHRQFEDVKHYLMEIQERFIREGKIEPLGKLPRIPDVYLLLSYLRCFDARSRGASNSEIAKVIYPLLNNEFPDLSGTQRAKDHLDAAQELIKSKYRYLANVTWKK